jgi:hypothetical protein
LRKRFAGEKKIGKAKFLRDEEGDVDDGDSEGESEVDESGRSSRESNRKGDIIRIDEVFERAHQ